MLAQSNVWSIGIFESCSHLNYIFWIISACPFSRLSILCALRRASFLTWCKFLITKILWDELYYVNVKYFYSAGCPLSLFTDCSREEEVCQFVVTLIIHRLRWAFTVTAELMRFYLDHCVWGCVSTFEWNYWNESWQRRTHPIENKFVLL